LHHIASYPFNSKNGDEMSPTSGKSSGLEESNYDFGGSHQVIGSGGEAEGETDAELG